MLLLLAEKIEYAYTKANALAKLILALTAVFGFTKFSTAITWTDRLALAL